MRSCRTRWWILELGEGVSFACAGVGVRSADIVGAPLFLCVPRPCCVAG